MWDYCERHLDPDLFVDRTLKGKVRCKVVVITGGSSGIGLSTAKRVAEAGAITVIVARGKEELFKARDEMTAAGGTVFAYKARSEEHTSEIPSLMRISCAASRMKHKKQKN